MLNFLIQAKSQNMEVAEMPLSICYENKFPTLGITLHKSKNPFEVVLCVYAEDDIKINDNSNLTILLENNESVTCSYMSKDDANKNIVINTEHTSWHFKKQPHAIFSIAKIYLPKLKTINLKQVLLYKLKGSSPEKMIYIVSVGDKDALRNLLQMQGF